MASFEHLGVLVQENIGLSIILSITTSLLCFIVSTLVWPGEDISPVPISPLVPDELRPGHSFNFGSTAGPELKDGQIWPKCPADGRRLTAGPIEPFTPEQVDGAIAKATEAQKSWAKTTFAQRKKVLNTILQYIIDHQEEIVQACCLDSGKTKIDACFGEILVSVEKLQWTVKHGEQALRPSKRSTNLLMAYKANTVVYEPLGVVAACFSWNYPFHSWISNVISAIFAGNGVVLKPSEQTCWSSQYFQAIVEAALSASGHDPGLVQTVICLPEVADYLTSHPGISHITFIGSRPVALKVCASAATALTPVCVELGGKDPAILLDDPATIQQLDDIVSIIMRGTFQCAGQNCIGIERVIALPKVYDLLLQKLEAKIKTLRLGSITMLKKGDADIDVGSMVSPASFDRLEELITSAEAQGGQVLAGGRRYSHPQYPDGHYFLPTLIANVSSKMDLAQQEVFSPVCLVIPAKDITDAIAIANSTPYGLGASVFGATTRQNRPILDRVRRQVRSGMISINDFGSYYACSMPFGGTKESGYGRFGGAEGLQALCNLKSVCEDAWWAQMVGIKTQIPPVLQYPVMGARGWESCKAIIKTGYGLTYVEQAKGIVQLLAALVGSGSGSGSGSAKQNTHTNGTAKHG